MCSGMPTPADRVSAPRRARARGARVGRPVSRRRRCGVARRTAERMWSMFCGSPPATSVLWLVVSTSSRSCWAGEGVAAALHEEELERDAVRELVARDAVRELVARDEVAADVLADRCVRAAARRAVDPDRERARREPAIAAADARGADDRTGERAGDVDGSRPEEGKEKLESSARFSPFARNMKPPRHESVVGSPPNTAVMRIAPGNAFLLSPTTARVRVVRRPLWALRDSLRWCRRR